MSDPSDSLTLPIDIDETEIPSTHVDNEPTEEEYAEMAVPESELATSFIVPEEDSE